jgi:hypothetical protein
MKIVTRFFHGISDYTTGLLLLGAPNLFGFAETQGAAVWVPRIIGLMILLQATMTDYELGFIKIIPIAVHLMADYVAGLFLVAAPWLFGFSGLRTATLLLVVAGLLIMGLTWMTEPRGRPHHLPV